MIRKILFIIVLLMSSSSLSQAEDQQQDTLVFTTMDYRTLVVGWERIQELIDDGRVGIILGERMWSASCQGKEFREAILLGLEHYEVDYKLSSSYGVASIERFPLAGAYLLRANEIIRIRLRYPEVDATLYSEVLNAELRAGDIIRFDLVGWGAL